MKSMTPIDTDSIRDDPGSVWTMKNGSAISGASSLDPLTLQPFAKISPPAGKADITKVFAISQTGIVTWVMDGSPYTEASTPILYGKSSDGWNANTTLHLSLNSTIDIIMYIANSSMDTVSLLQPFFSRQPDWFFKRRLLLTLFDGAQDGSSYASPRTQVLGSGFRRGSISLFVGDRSPVLDDQSTGSFVPGHYRFAPRRAGLRSG